MNRAEQVSRRLKLRHLNAFLAACRTGTMVKAAEHLGVSQPVISKTIAELERIVGVRLLDRGHKGVEPTLHGRALLKRSIALFDDLRTTAGELAFLSDPTAGELRVGCEETLSTGLLPALIERLARKYPRLTFDMAIADPRTLCERDLRGRKVEVAIMRIAKTELDEEFEARTLYNDRLWVVAGIQNSRSPRRKVALSDLVDECWCLPPPDHPVGALVIDAFRRNGLEPPRRTATVGSAQCTSNLIAKGEFIGVLGSMFLRFNPPSVRLKVLAELPVRATSISIVTLKDRTLSPVARLFIDCAREVTKPLAKDG